MRDLTRSKGLLLFMFKPRSLFSKLAGRRSMLLTPIVVLAISVPVLAATGTGVNGSGTGQNTGTASLTVTKPTGVAVGDVMIANISYRSASSLVVTAPTGWESVAA